ncbi:MAG: Flagellar hook-length control protein, partial [Petrotoga mobilis]
MNIALTDLITNLPKSNNINNFTTNASNTKLESFDQKLQDIFSNIEENLGFKNSPMPGKEVLKKEVLKNNKKNNGSNELLIKTIEKSNNNLLVTLNVNDSKDLIISNTKKNKNIKLDVDQLLLLIETSIKNAKNIDKKQLLIQAQKKLSSSKTEFTVDDIEVLQKVFNIIIKERASNTEIHLEGLIKHSKFIDETPSTLSQNNIHSNGSQETNQIVSPDIQKLLQIIEKTSKSIENKNEINTLEQAQKILISSKTELTEEDKEVLQKAFSIIMKESKASNSKIPLVGLIKHSKSIEETPSTLSQNNLQSKGSQEAGQIVNSDIQKLLSTIQESSKNIENKDEINTLEQAQKILSSFKTEFTPDELNIIKTALGINTNNNSKMGNSSSNLIEEATLITNSLIKGNTDKTKNNKYDRNIWKNKI